MSLLCYATNHGELCAPRATADYCSNTNLAKQHAHCGYFGTLIACGKGVVHVRVFKRSAMARFRVSAFLTSLQDMLTCSQAVQNIGGLVAMLDGPGAWHPNGKGPRSLK